MTSAEAFKEWYENHRRESYKTIAEMAEHAWEAALEWKAGKARDEWEVVLNDVEPVTECEQGYTTVWSDTTPEKALNDAITDFVDHAEWGVGYKPGDKIRIMRMTDGLGNTVRSEELYELRREHFYAEHPGLTKDAESGN